MQRRASVNSVKMNRLAVLVTDGLVQASVT